MIFEIKIHSITSLITNSSTTIYTRSDASEEAFKKMVELFFVAFNIQQKFDDIFETITLSDCDAYESYVYRREVDGITAETNISKLYVDVRCFKLPKPTWFFEAEKRYKNSHSSTFYIRTKDTKFDQLAQSILNFLYSTESFEGNC